MATRRELVNIPPFEDMAVLYHSADDNCWIAHSLRTDQIGTGGDMGEALEELIRGIDQLLAIADSDATVAYLREAPTAIQDLAKHSKKLPAEIYEVAHKRARGCWPEDIQPAFNTTSDDQAFVAELQPA